MKRRQWVKKDKKFIQAIFLNVLEGILSGSVLGMVLMAIDALFTGSLNMGRLMAISGVIAGIFVVRLVLYSWGYTAGHVGGAVTAKNMRLFLGEKIKRLPLSGFSKEKTGRYINVITHDVNNYEDILTHKVGDIAKNITLTAMALAFLLSVNLYAGLVNLLLVLLVVPAVRLSFRAVQKYGGLKKELLNENVSDLVEYITGIQTLRSYGLGGSKNRKVNDSLKAISDISYRFEAKVIPIGAVFSGLVYMGMPLAILIGGTQWLRGDITATALAVCAILPLYIAAIATTLFIDLTAYKNMLLSKDSMDRLAGEQEEPAGEAGFAPAGYDVAFHNVSFRYEQEEPVLENVSFTAENGRLTAIVGDSGAGKSTILNLIAKFYEPQSGDIAIGGAGIGQVRSETVHEAVSMVYQDVFLFNDTIRNNIKFARPAAGGDAVAKACAAANCDRFIAALEHGYDTVVGENGNRLSGGERQRISIARAILKDSPVILLDEATASLDIENELAVREAVMNLLEQNKTVIMVAHNLSVIQNADRILVLAKGKIVEQGTHDVLLKKHGKYYAMWRAQHPEAV